MTPSTTLLNPLAADGRSADAGIGPLMVDIGGCVLDDDDRRRLRHPRVGGVILFSRNFADPGQLRALCHEIHALRPGLLVAVDQEGGRVQRFRDGFTAIPPMRDLGGLWDQDPHGACAEAQKRGFVLGQELRAVGVDLSFTPVLDLDHGRSSVVGTRAFHRDPVAVTALARALSHGLLLAGMASCGKHFPGHGWTAVDSHVGRPVDERSLDELMAADLRPFQDLAPILSAIMPAHIVYPQIDPDHTAGFSRIWLQDILRGRLGFDGLIFSDDLSMDGAGVAGGTGARVRAARQAGCDMALICNRPDTVDQVLDDPALADCLDIVSDEFLARFRRVRQGGQRIPARPWSDGLRS